MDLAAMIVRFREGNADRSTSDMNDAAVQAILDTAWRFTLPGEIDGTFREGSIAFNTTSAKQDYDLDSAADVGSANAGMVRAVEKGIRISDERTPLAFYDDFNTFFCEYIYSDTSVGRPQSVLVRKRTLTLRPIPNGVFSIVVPGSLFNPALTSNGVANDDHALTAVRIALRDYAAEQGADSTSARYSELSESALERVRAQAQARPVGNYNKSWIDF